MSVLLDRVNEVDWQGWGGRDWSPNQGGYMKTYHVWPAVLHGTCLLTRLHISPWKSSQMPEFWDTERKANMSGSDPLVPGCELHLLLTTKLI